MVWRWGPGLGSQSGWHRWNSSWLGRLELVVGVVAQHADPKPFKFISCHVASLEAAWVVRGAWARLAGPGCPRVRPPRPARSPRPPPASRLRLGRSAPPSPPGRLPYLGWASANPPGPPVQLPCRCPPVRCPGLAPHPVNLPGALATVPRQRSPFPSAPAAWPAASACRRSQPAGEPALLQPLELCLAWGARWMSGWP
jgi:hypothetical protein